MWEILNELPRESKIELNKYWVSISLEFLWWVWDFEKWVSLTWSATKLTINFPDGRKSVWLIDFWMFQWCENELKYNEILPFDLKEIDFVLLTHTHVDHLWKMLHFSKQDFDWVIWTTKVNKEVLTTMLSDVIKLQPKNDLTQVEKIEEKIKNYLSLINEMKWFWADALDQINWVIEDLENEKKELLKEVDIKKNEKEFFEKQDLMNLLTKINSVWYNEKVEVKNDIEISFISAGHLPWSAQIILKIKAANNKYVKIWFSWDLWKVKNPAVWWAPIVSKTKLDLYMIESTYAGRSHPNFLEEEKKLIKSLNETLKRWWKVLFPIFMQWRAQELWIYLNYLIWTWKIPDVPLFYHSNNIEKITEIYARNFPELFWKLIKWWNFNKAVTWKWKKRQEHFNNYKWPAIILASWWMMDWWAIQNYLDLLENPNNLFVSAWYQWENTLGHKVFTEQVDQIELPKIWKININSRLHNLRWFSGHADEEDLLYLLSQMSFSKDAKIVINHWEKWVSQTLFWLAIKWVVGRTREILFADFNENNYIEKS